MRIWRNIVITLTILAGLSIIGIPMVRAFAPVMYVQALDDAGNILNGATAGAATFTSHEYISILDATGHIINTFGGGGGGTTITSGAGDFGSATAQSGAVLTGVVTGGANLTGTLGAIFDAGTIGAAGTASCNMSGKITCKFTVGAGGMTIAVPTNMTAGVLYHLRITSTANQSMTFAAGWQVLKQNTSLFSGMAATSSGPAGAIIDLPFALDGGGTNVDALESYPELSGKFGYFGTLASGAFSTTGAITTTTSAITSTTGIISSSTGAIGPTGGGVLQSYGGTLPTCACTGGSPTCVVATAGSNSAGQIQLTGGTAVTTCTLTFSASGTFHAAPICVATDANASITPLSFSVGAVSTSTAVFDFAAATATNFNYVCIGH